MVFFQFLGLFCFVLPWGANLSFTHVAFSDSFVYLSLGKNKRVGKQLASQKILQMLHPHVKNWGSLLRMYGRESNKMVKKVEYTLKHLMYSKLSVFTGKV